MFINTIRNNQIFNRNRVVYLILAIIVVIAFGLRVYKIDLVPPAISWDEASVGYDAYSIANYGYDQWGNFLPLVFKSFEDDKSPVHVYFTAISVKALGLSDFSIRFPMALFGVFNVITIFFLAKELFKNNNIGLISAFLLAISPYSIQFSRFNHEANFALFFLMFGILMFIKGTNNESTHDLTVGVSSLDRTSSDVGKPTTLQSGFSRDKYLLPISFLSFGISILSYHSSKVVVPVVILVLVSLYWKSLWKAKDLFIISVLVFAVILSAFLFNPALFGTARLNQTSISKGEIEKTTIYQNTQNKTLGWLQIVGESYLTHFTYNYLFVSGDKNPRHSPQVIGEFYKIDSLFLIIGLIYLIFLRSKASITILVWALLAPIPAAISGIGEAPHAARALFMMGSWHLIAGLGFYKIVTLFKNPKLQILLVFILLFLQGFFLRNYFNDYLNIYAPKYSIEWQYGMKQIGEYIKGQKNYSQIYMTEVRHQPYIFFLFYLKTPLSDFLNSVRYTQDDSRSYNLVQGFEHYHFGDWDPIESMPNGGVLYILSPSEYDGLRHKLQFDVKKVIKYLNGENAFFLVSAF